MSMHLLTNDDIEKLKEKYDIDKRIAEKYNKPKGEIVEDFDPRLVRILQKWLLKKQNKKNQ